MTAPPSPRADAHALTLVRRSPARAFARATCCVLTAGLALGAGAAARAQDSDSREVRGVVRAEAAATLSSELVARIVALPFKPGQSFRAGDTLVSFDCRRYQAELQAAEAEVRAQKITVDTNRQLLKHRAAGANDLALAEAKRDQADASAEALRARTSQCVIAAPYDGRIVDRSVDVFEVPQANAPLLRIVKDGSLEVDLIVPSSWSVWIKAGYEFAFKVDETGTIHRARLLNPAAVVDPVSRTMKLTAQFVEPAVAVRPGMSGTALFKAPSTGAD